MAANQLLPLALLLAACAGPDVSDDGADLGPDAGELVDAAPDAGVLCFELVRDDSQPRCYDACLYCSGAACPTDCEALDPVCPGYGVVCSACVLGEGQCGALGCMAEHECLVFEPEPVGGDL